MVDTLVLGTSASAWGFESLLAHQSKRKINMKWTESRIFRGAEAGYKLAKIMGIIFWLPFIALFVWYWFF